MKRLIISLLLVVCQPVLADIDNLMQDSRQLIKTYATQLKKQLQQSLQAEGIVAAIKHCQVVVPEMDTGSLVTGRIKRTSRFVRNPKNTADAWESKVLASFATRQQQGENVNALEFHEVTRDETGKKQFRYMKAIAVQPLCLNCHGEHLKDEVKWQLKQLYPMDQATGFQIDDLRGAFSILRHVD